MDTKEITGILNKISIEDVTGSLEYNPLEIFVNRVREKEICHTAIIADLLNPYGKHQLGTLFVYSFLNFLNVASDDFSVNELEIKKERKVKSSLTNMDERSIDICLQIEKNGGKCAIIIENKMNNAGEQTEQLSDYKRALEEEGYNVMKTVCLQGSYYKYIGADIDITPKELFSIWEPLVPDSAFGIKAYLTLLENMDKKTDLSKNANEFLRLDDNEIKKIRTIALSFNEIANPVFTEIINKLKEKKLDFKLEKNGLNTGNIYKIIDVGPCLQLWNEEAYNKGPNKGFWMEIWFYDFNRFEIWIAQYENSNDNLDLENYTKRLKERGKWYYGDASIDPILNNGKKTKKFDFPNKNDFKEMINYVFDLYKNLYKLSN